MNPHVNVWFAAMVSHHLFDAEFCNPASRVANEPAEKNDPDECYRLLRPTNNSTKLKGKNA